MRKGGYVLVDFRDINLTVDQTTVVPGVYDTLYFNKRKLARLTGVTIGGKHYADMDAMIETGGNAYILLTPEYHILVASNGVQVTEVETGGGKLYAHTVTVWGDETGDLYTMYYIISPSSDKITTDAGLNNAVYNGCIGIISQYGVSSGFMLIISENYTAMRLDGEGAAYPNHGAPHSDDVKEL